MFMIYEMTDPFIGAMLDNMVVISMLIALKILIVVFLKVQHVLLIDPPVMFVMAWGKLSQQFNSGNPNLTGEFMPVSIGTSEPLMRVPTCPGRFNGIHFTRHLTGGFYFSRLKPHQHYSV